MKKKESRTKGKQNICIYIKINIYNMALCFFFFGSKPYVYLINFTT